MKIKSASISGGLTASNSFSPSTISSGRRASLTSFKLRLECDLLPYLADEGLLYAYDNSSNVSLENHQGQNCNPPHGNLHFWCQIKTAGSPILANQYYLEYYTHLPSVEENYYTKIHNEVTKGTRRDLNFKGLNVHGEDGILTALENRLSSNLNSNPPSLHGPTIVGPVYIHPSAIIHSLARIGPYVSIGEDVSIGAGVAISHALILPRTCIQVRIRSIRDFILFYFRILLVSNMRLSDGIVI